MLWRLGTVWVEEVALEGSGLSRGPAGPQYLGGYSGRLLGEAAVGSTQGGWAELAGRGLLWPLVAEW